MSEKMGLFRKLKLTWKTMTTKDKLEMFIDILSGLGSGMCGAAIGSRLSEGRNRFETICIKTATAGLGMAAADVSSKALKENVVPFAVPLINKAREETAKAREKAKVKVEQAKEAAAHE